MGMARLRAVAAIGLAAAVVSALSCSTPTEAPRRAVMPISNFDPGGSEWRRRAETPRAAEVPAAPSAGVRVEALPEPLPPPTVVTLSPPEPAPAPPPAAPPPQEAVEVAAAPIIDIDLLEFDEPSQPAPRVEVAAATPPAPEPPAAATSPETSPADPAPSPAVPPSPAPAEPAAVIAETAPPARAAVAVPEPLPAAAPMEATPSAPRPAPAGRASPATREAAAAARPTGSPSAAASAILRRAARGEDPSLRANALEGLLSAPASLEEALPAALTDSNRGVRFVAAMCVGDARLANLAHLVEPLLQDPSESVRAAALYALRRCGHRIDLTPLARMVRSNDPEVRSNAFMVLGKLGDASAVGLIRSSLGRGMNRVNPIRVRLVELQAAEALLQLGQDDEIEAVRAALFAPVEQGELSILGCQILLRVGDESSAAMLERLVEASGPFARPPEIRLAAAEALAGLRIRGRFDLAAIAEEASARPEPLLRVQSAALLGRLGGARSLQRLEAMLSDADPAVRVAAAGNLLRVAGEGAASPAIGVR